MKDLIKKSIESHGGIYSGSLDMETTTLLILTKPEGDKYRYAIKWRIPCVTSDWVFDSIEKAQCLGTEPYRVDNLNTRYSYYISKQKKIVEQFHEILFSKIKYKPFFFIT